MLGCKAILVEGGTACGPRRGGCPRYGSYADMLGVDTLPSMYGIGLAVNCLWVDFMKCEVGGSVGLEGDGWVG